MAMRKAICVGDSPVTGGAVLPYPVQWENTLSGHQVAMINGKVNCEACKSTGIIIKTGGSYRVEYDTGYEHGETALEGDACLCKCSPPPPIKATVAEWGMDVEDTRYGEGASSETYDEQIRAIDQKTGQVLDGVAYLIKTSTGKIYKGYTDEFGLCPRIDTDSTENLTVWFGISAFEQEGLL